VYCRARVKTQRPWLKEIEKTFKALRIHQVPLLAEEVRGVAQLEGIGRKIWKARK
jgi:anion-transporting  ArsA/GET3 family ATPase